MIRITNARWLLEQGQPVLELMTSDGVTVRVWDEQKRPVLAQGIVWIDAPLDWRLTLLPPIMTTEDGTKVQLDHAFVADPLVAKLTHDFVRAVDARSFCPRPVAVERVKNGTVDEGIRSHSRPGG